MLDRLERQRSQSVEAPAERLLPPDAPRHSSPPHASASPPSGAPHSPSSSPGPKRGTNANAMSRSPVKLRRGVEQWAEEVNRFGQSGKCQSLSALLEHGYLVWKKQLRDLDPLASRSASRSGNNGSRGLQRPFGFGAGGSGKNPASALNEPSAASLYEEADRCFNQEQFARCIELCGEALRSERAGLKSSNQPLYVKILRLRGEAFFHAERFQLCLVDVEKILALGGGGETQHGGTTTTEFDQGMVYYRQAMALLSLGRSERALEAIMQAMQLEPQNVLLEEAFAVIFEAASSVIASGRPKQDETRQSPRRNHRPTGGAGPGNQHRGGVVGGGNHQHQPRLSAAALETLSSTTQATRLSSQSTTPSPSNYSRSSSFDKALLDEA